MVFVGVTTYLSTETVLLYFCHKLFRGTDLEDPTQALVFLMCNIVAVGSLILYRAKTRNRWIDRQARYWIAQRAGGRLPAADVRRRRVQRRILWLPTLLSLVVVLFFPEVLGMATHLSHGSRVRLYNTRVPVPVNWMIVEGDFSERNPRSWVTILLGKGIARVGPTPYLHGRPPLSAITFSISPDWEIAPQPPAGAKVTDTATIALGPDAITCWDILLDRNPRYYSIDTNLTIVECGASKSHLHAYFSGERDDVQRFYALLSHVKEE